MLYRSFPDVASESFLAFEPKSRSPKFPASFAAWLLGNKYGARSAPIQPIRALLSLLKQPEWAALYAKCSSAEIAVQIKIVNGEIAKRCMERVIIDAFGYSNTFQASTPAQAEMARLMGYSQTTPHKEVPLAWVEESYRTQFPSKSKKLARELSARQGGTDLVRACLKRFPELGNGEVRLEDLASCVLAARTGLSPEEAKRFEPYRKKTKNSYEDLLVWVKLARETRARIYNESLLGVLVRLHKANPRALRDFLSKYIAAQIESQLLRGQPVSVGRMLALACAFCAKTTWEETDASALVRWLYRQEDLLRLLCCLYVRSSKGVLHFLEIFIRRQDSLLRNPRFQFLKQMGPGWDRIVGSLEENDCRLSFEQICDLASAASPRPPSFAAGKRLLERADLKRRVRGKAS